MLRPRLTPCLLIKNGALVKTVRFTEPKYIGDPLNAVRIFNEKEVDELLILDISASSAKKKPDFQLIENLATQCRMPLCYGGGVTTVDEIVQLVSMGVEKVALSSAAIENPSIITAAARKVGNQSIVVVLDVRRNRSGKLVLMSMNAKVEHSIEPLEFARIAQSNGAGEIVINDVDRDGTLQGYDLDMIEQFRNAHTLPMTVIGGAGSLEHCKQLFDKFGLIGAGAGSLFVFKGVYKAVLINYPDAKKRESLYSSCLTDLT